MFLLLIIMGAIPLFIVLTLGAVNLINELERATYRDGMLRNTFVSEHVTDMCEKNFYVLHALAMNYLIKQ